MTRCDGCMWNEQCGRSDPCEDYTPIEQDYDEIIERNRSEFHAEWHEYMNEMAD